MGYEINFNRYFYEYHQPRPLEEIEDDIQQVEEEILAILREVACCPSLDMWTFNDNCLQFGTRVRAAVSLEGGRLETHTTRDSFRHFNTST